MCLVSRRINLQTLSACQISSYHLLCASEFFFLFLENQPKGCVNHQSHAEFTLGFGSLFTLIYANIKTAAELELSAQ